MELWKEKKPIPYQLALTGIDALVQSKKFIGDLNSEMHTHSVVSAMANFIRTGIKGDEKSGEPEIYELSFSILETPVASISLKG